MPTGLGDEQLWLSATNDNTGSSTAFDDLSGEGNDGTASGTTVVADTSEGGSYAYDFDGTNDYIGLPAGIGTNSEASYSINYWYRRDTSNNAHVITMVGDGTQTLTNSPIVKYEGSSTFKYGNRNGILSSNSSTLASNWTHVSVVVSGTNASYYEDGALVDSGTTQQNADLSLSGRIGAWGTGGDEFEGRIDDIRIYDRAITQAEITHLASSRGVEGPPPVGLGDELMWLCPSLNDSPDDISGNGNNGTYNGGMGTVADTSYGGSLAYEFDGTDDFIELPLTAMNFGSGDFSVSFWVSSTDTNGGPLLNNYSGGGASGKYLLVNLNNDGSASQTGDITFTLDDGSNKSDWKTSSKTYNDGNWRHFTVVRDNTAGLMYLYEDANPTPVASVSVAGIGDLNGSQAMRIGSWTQLVTRSTLDGKMDDIRHYDRAITQAEITHLASSRGVEGSPSTPTTQYNAFATHAFKQLFQTRLR